MASSKDKGFYEELWDNNKVLAETTLNTPFLQHMQLGDLQADKYVIFMIQDINYLVKVTDMLEKMWEKEMDEELREFMKARYESYKKYAEKTLKEFNLKSVSNIIPTAAMEKYLSDYKDIMNKHEPIYFAVALLAGVWLWQYLANQLKETCCNAYFTWKTENMDGKPENFRELLNKRLTKDEDKKKAHEIFHQQIQNEQEFFSEMKSEQ